MARKSKAGFATKPDPQTGNIKLFFTKDEKLVTPGLSASPAFVSGIISGLLGESIKVARGAKKQPHQADDIPFIQGLSLALSQGPESTIDLHVRAGNAEFCIRMGNNQASDLARALLTVSETQGRA